MGRGNVCPRGAYEGVYYIPTEHLHVFRKNNDPDDPFGECEPETRLLRDIILDDTWTFDDEGSANEEEDVLDCFMENFRRMYPSFERAGMDEWLSSSRRVILESNLFYVTIEDNEWALAIELIQKEGTERSLSGLQSHYYQKYLDGIKRALLERVPSIGFYKGPWTSGRLTREDIK